MPHLTEKKSGAYLEEEAMNMQESMGRLGAFQELLSEILWKTQIRKQKQLSNYPALKFEIHAQLLIQNWLRMGEGLCAEGLLGASDLR